MKPFVKYKHHFEAPKSGGQLCIWCGHLKKDSLHFDVPEGWEPMETAPRDGTHILVIRGSGEETIVFWQQNLSAEDCPPYAGWFFYRLGGAMGERQAFPLVSLPRAWRAQEEN